MSKDKIKVLLVASESVPFAKVGGLADIIGALGKELVEEGIDARIVIPKHLSVYNFIKENNIKIKNRYEVSFQMEYGEAKGYVEEVVYNKVIYYFIENENYFKRDGIYIDNQTKYDYIDNLERFTFFSKATLEALKIFDFKPNIVHANDWQTGLIPVYLKTTYRMDSFFKTVKVIFTVHNLAYQGIFPVEQFVITGLDWKYFTINGLEYYGHLNLMKGGIVFSDIVTTVSKTYAEEIQTPEFGNGLEGVIKDKASANKLFGIITGVDYQEWSPSNDIYLKKEFGLNYDFNTLENKRKIKKMFLERNGIKNVDEKVPLIGIVSRLVDQKGFDLIFEILDELLKKKIYFTVLGTGKSEYENKLRSIKENYPDKTVIFIGFDIPNSHYIEAASDIYLMPSRFEPCGLNQLYSIRYGTIPIVRNTGGLADTVKNEKTGFVFDNYNPDELLKTINYALDIYNNDYEKWKKMMINCMKEDWSWKKAAKNYIDLYNKIIKEE